MKEFWHKWLLAIFSAIIAFGVGVYISAVSILNWIVDTAINKFGLDFNMSISSSEIASAMWRYKSQIG